MTFLHTSFRIDEVFHAETLSMMQLIDERIESLTASLAIARDCIDIDTKQKRLVTINVLRVLRRYCRAYTFYTVDIEKIKNTLISTSTKETLIQYTAHADAAKHTFERIRVTIAHVVESVSNAIKANVINQQYADIEWIPSIVAASSALTSACSMCLMNLSEYVRITT